LGAASLLKAHTRAEKACSRSSRRGAAGGFLDPHETLALRGGASAWRTRIERLAREQTPITADTALRLARYFGTTPGFWMNIQAQFDLECAADELAAALKKIEPLKRDAA
jgi:addiction module HigA family antidote